MPPAAPFSDVPRTRHRARLGVRRAALACACAIAIAIASFACILPLPLFEGYACGDGHDCAAGFACVDGRCARACTSDAECAGAGTQQCVAGACVAVDVDGGVPDDDAGAPDDGGVDDDAGAPDDDAGVPDDDAGEPDAGNDAPDAGNVVCFGDPQVCAEQNDVVTVCDDSAGPCAGTRTARTINAAVDPAAAGASPSITVFIPAGTYAEHVVLDDALPVVLVGEPGAVVESTLAALELFNLADVTASGLVFRGTGFNTDVIRVRGTARLALDACTVGPSDDNGVDSDATATIVIERSTITGNREGGLVLRGPTRVENTVIIGNGNDGPGSNGSARGAAELSGPADQVVFRFNLLRDNDAQNASVRCFQPITIDSIISFNELANGGELDANCFVTRSRVANLGAVDANQGNFADDPQLLADGIHIAETSPCVGRGNPAAPARDFDGDTRDDGAPDVGVDER